ncbi:MAG: hypothetical protein HY721_04610 [Planctomycetes bacterium]|nr:hypothetical protein [Planctomycetota bacterium]
MGRRALLCAGLFLALGGCGAPMDVVIPDMEDILWDHHFKYETQDLTPAALEERMREIDEYYAEPRSYGKLYLSYETSLKSISPVNGYEALWRGARACAAIALDEKEPRERRLEFAGKGIAIAREAVKKMSHRVEPYYYHALSIGALADVRQDATRDQLTKMKELMKLAIAIDEKFDYAGPHRFLGQLITEVNRKGLLIYSLGSDEEGLGHLKRSIELFPEYGENHLAYARALAAEEEVELARAELERTMTSPRPRDRSAEHQAWLEEATALLTDLQGK